MITPLAARRGMITPLARGVQRESAVSWWLSGGIDAANCIAAYQPKGAADYATSKVNLNNPGTTDAVDGAAYPTWDSTNGWKFYAASSQWLDTNILPTATTSAIVKFTNGNAISSNCVFGSYSGNNTTRFTIYNRRSPSNDFVVYEHANNLNVAPSTAAAVLGISGQKGYRNGAAETGTIAGTWSGTATKTIGIGKQNGYIQYGTFYCQAIVFYSVSITPEQVLAVSIAMAAL